MLNNFKYTAFGACALTVLAICFSLVWLADQYLIYEAINKGADPAKLAVLKCGVK